MTATDASQDPAMSDPAGQGGGRGRLAEMLASRGGTAAPEAAFVIEHREALIYMLCEAAELEHGIMCQYLFAAFSLKQSEDEGLTTGELDAVTRWRKAIAHVATEEMLHLALVHNLLSAIGAAPHFARPNLPAPAHHYPAGVNLTLVPFGAPALRHFIFLERPEGMELHGARGIDAPVHEAVPLMSERDIVPQPQDFATVGHLYRSIEQGFAHLADKFGERNLFVGPPRAQAIPENFHWPELVAVNDLASAQKAIDTILEQGEGARGQWEHAHFGQFVQILQEYEDMLRAKPGFDPVRPVTFATVRRCEHDDAVPQIAERVTSRVGDLFNVSYEILLQIFERYFAHTEETDEQLGTLADATVALMLRVLKPLGNLITTLPVGPAFPGMNAGPSFELFYENDYLMPHRGAAWALLEERIREAASFCGLIQEIAPESLAAELAPVEEALSDVADALAARFAEWGARSRFAGCPERQRAAADGQAAKALARRAASLTRGVESVDGTAPGAKRLITLFNAARATFDHAGDGETAARIIESVLRPIAEAATGKRHRKRTKVAAAGGGAGDAALDGQLWTLAQNATRELARWRGDPEQETPLTEATAALQDLALRSSPPDERDARLATLRELLADRPPGIRCAHNGPYLVTNAEAVRDWLGQEIQATPALALCRCGESQIKPVCDGACASSGFTDKKDPKRVPDKRDTYEGVQVTAYDNRGICQHSGFCTDRLASVYHVDTEPFVTPSGGRMDEIIRAVRDCPSGALSFAIDRVEARAQVDWDGEREPAIEVSKDGPYRITGGIPLTDHHGEPVTRAEGSSLEHYALCRCGHSQNKPFCSGMHWYIEFSDPVLDPGRESTLFEWCGGLPALTRVTRIFYEKHVPEDALLAPLFASMSPDHPVRVARWLGEVFGGPKLYSDTYGGYDRMISQHLGKGLTEEQRARWVELISLSARDAGLPADPEFQAAFHAYLEWGSRIALENSQPGAKPPPNMPVPKWGWVCDATPGSRISALATDAAGAAPEIDLPGADETVSFERHIKPMFRERDRTSMKFAFDLWSQEDVKLNAEGILERLRNGSMPCDGAWPPDWIEVFERWNQSGTAT
jgi:CDGSH-type Zn-finger protein/truncated hemoglobin YjbI